MTQESQKSNTVLIIIAIIGVVGTIVAATIGAIGNYNTEKLRQETELTRIAFISVASQGGATQSVLQNAANIPTDLPTPTYKNLTATPDIKISETSIVPNSVLFEENFEDDRAQGFDYISGDWKIIEDDAGNKVYELDNTNVGGFSSVLKFGSNTWKNYEIQCRVKMLNLIGNAVPEFLVYFNYDNSASPSGYVLNLQPSSEVADLVRVNSGQWEKGVSRHYKYSPNTWYSIRIIAKDSVIQVYINDALVADTDYQTKAGGIEINIGPKSKIQLDDIEVIKIGE